MIKAKHFPQTTILLFSIAAAGAAAPPAQVQVSERTVVLPTYEMGPPDKSPIFAGRRAYQGANSPVYPYPMWDAVTDVRVDRKYSVVCLENEYIEICMLPEIGGRLLSARDKTNGYDFLYRQNVIKPALVGMAGAWISGGIEWNIPHHHRASTYMPLPYSVSKGPDGSATVRVGELELRHRMRWLVELTMRPGSSCVEQTVRLVNRTPETNSFLFFANIAVHATPEYQVIFPPDTNWVTNHGKREFSRWPVADSIYNGIDFRKGVDVSWWKNHPSPISMFVHDSKMDFVAGYDHGRRAGFVHVADHRISPGKKFFTWGNGEAGRMWDRVLTEKDGPYIELMAGAYSNNQPDYSWIQPYQTKTAEAFWYPVNGIGGVKNANRRAAVNLEVTPANVARIAVAPTSSLPALTVTLSGASGIICEKNGAANPGQPFRAECPVPAGAGRLTVRAKNGAAEVIAYTVVENQPGPAPEVVRPPARPETIANNEELFYAGLRLEQLHSAALDAEDYYRELLRRDPADPKANLALGVHALRRGDPAAAEAMLAKAANRTTPAYIWPKDGEASYFLGLARRALGREERARDSFARAAWVAGWESPANYQLAEMDCVRGDLAGAHVYLDRALAANAANVKALTLKAVLLRKQKRPADARRLLARAAALDPLDSWHAWESHFLDAGAAPASATDPQEQLEAATDYAGASLWSDAAAVLAASTGKAATHALIRYFQAFYREKAGKTAEAASLFALAKQASPDYAFPFRREAEEVLERALTRDPGDHRAAYYLGNLYFLQGRPEKAVARWEEARRLHPAFALVHRNLAVAYSRQPNRLAEAIGSLEAAIRLEPAEPRYHLELDQLHEAAGTPPEKRLALFEKNHDVIARRDDSLARAIGLYVETGRHERALELLRGRQFHVWEGAGRTAVHNSFTEAHLELGHRHLAAGRHQQAIAEYAASLEYPVNLGTGRPFRGERLPESYYFLGLAQQAAGDARAALASFDSAIQTAPATLLDPQRPGATDEPEMFYYAAKALEKRGRASEAARVYRGLIEAGKAQLADHVPMYFFASFGHPQPEKSRYAQAHYVTGLGLLGAGRPADARREFQEALKLNPMHSAARKRMKP